jgi:hypothetical protein
MTTTAWMPSDLRLLGNIAYLATKMRWQDEGEALYGALAPVVQSQADLYFAWLAARCEFGDIEGACALMDRLERLPGAPADLLLMARCYLQCCCNAPEWVDTARRVVRGGPEHFGYDTARAMLDEHDRRCTR